MELEKKIKDYLEKHYHVQVISITCDDIKIAYTIGFTLTGEKLKFQVYTMYQEGMPFEAIIFQIINTINKEWINSLRKD